MPRPIDVPSGDFDASPDYSICFAQEWLPAVVTALSALARPETYDTSDPAVAFDAALRGSQAQLLALQGCGDTRCSSVFIKNNNGYNDHTNTSVKRRALAGCSGCTDNPLIEVGFVPLDPSSEIADSALKFWHVDDLCLTGVRVCQFHAFQVDGTIGNVFNFVWDSCIESNLTDIQAGELFFKDNFIMQQWGLSSLAPYMYFIQWQPGVECSCA